MKFTIPTQEFNYLISKCLNVVSQKMTIPILSNLLVEASNGMVTITATDLTVGVRCYAEANVIEEGATTLPAKKLAQLIRELTSTNLEVTTGENEITEIVADSSRFRIKGLAETEFPSLPDLEGANRFTLKQADLKDVLYRTAFAVSREDNRFVLTGVSLSIVNGVATFAGTDGKRLARTFMPISIDASFSGNYVIPLKAVEEAVKNLRDEGEATLYLLSDKIAFQMSDATIICKLLTGDYPDINRVIPEKVEVTVTLHREELMTLLRQVSLFVNGESHAARFSFANGELKLAAASMEFGEGNVSMPVNYQGEAIEIAFDPTFFFDILRHSKNETVTLGITDSYNPGIIADCEQQRLVTAEASPLFVLMPMRLSAE